MLCCDKNKSFLFSSIDDISNIEEIEEKYSFNIDEMNMGGDGSGESSNQSKRSLTNEKIPEPCLVCGVPSFTLHLQVNACYACAAFYRRSINTHSGYRCQKNNEQCDLTIKTIGKPLCRLCRYNKCVEVGMIISSKNRGVGSGGGGDNSSDNDFSQDSYHSLNMEEIFEKVKTIFEIQAPPTEETNYTQTFTEVLMKFLEIMKPKKPLTLFTDNEIRINFTKNYYVKTAQMLSNYPPFSSLSQDEKILLHSRFWQTFHIFERFFQVTEHFGTETDDDGRIPLDDSQYLDLQNVSYIFEGNNDGIRTFILPILEKSALLLNTFKKSKITVFEFAYTSQIALWSGYDILNLTPSTRELAEKIIKQLSNDLHNYYVNELRLVSYASRQAQLFRLISSVEVIIREKQQMLAAKQIFDFGSNSFTFCEFEIDYFDLMKKFHI